MAIFNIGETVIASCEVRDNAGDLADPATSIQIVITQVTPQSLMKVTATDMTKDSVGIYHYDCQTADYMPGTYQILYIATNGSRIEIKKDTFALE